LISLNRQNVIAEANRQDAEHRRFLPEWVTRSTFFDFLHGLGGAGENDVHMADHLMGDDLDYAGGGQVLDGHEGFNPFGLFDVFGGGLPPRGPPSSTESKFYKPEYTHPGKPPAGYTYDFAPSDTATTSGSSSPTVIVVDDDDEAGPSIKTAGSTSSSMTAVETTLVCARCLDPLVMGHMTDEQATKSRVWVLRCGHMLDGKCIEELMRPPVRPISQAVQPVKGKGKARASTSVDVDLADASSQDIKGARNATLDAAAETWPAEVVAHDRKGKGKAVDLPEPPLAPDNYLDNSIRSRLRPRHPPSTGGPAGLSGPLPVVSDRPARPAPRRRGYHTQGPRIKRGRGKARKPVIEERYEWVCPVAGCGHMHVSVRVDGVWNMDEQQGAVAAFL